MEMLACLNYQRQEVLQFKNTVLDLLKKERDALIQEKQLSRASNGAGISAESGSEIKMEENKVDASHGIPRIQTGQSTEGDRGSNPAQSGTVRTDEGHVVVGSGSPPGEYQVDKNGKKMNLTRSPSEAVGQETQHAVTRRAAGRLEATAAAAAAAAAAETHPRGPDPAQDSLNERDACLGKIAMRESRLILGTQSIAPLLQRQKTHWDYVLEEVQWLALDFRQEMRWKMGLAQSTARVVQEKVNKENRARGAIHTDTGSGDREEEGQRKVRAAAVAKEVAAFWEQVGGPRAAHLFVMDSKTDCRVILGTEGTNNDAGHSIEGLTGASTANRGGGGAVTGTGSAAEVNKLAQGAPAVSSTFFEAPTLMGVSDASSVFTTRKQLQKAVAAAAISSVTPATSSVSDPPPTLVCAAYGLGCQAQVQASSYNFASLSDCASKFLAQWPIIHPCLGSGETDKDPSSPLLPHQRVLVKQLLSRTGEMGAGEKRDKSAPFCGTLVYGKEYVGKTTAVLAAASKWLETPASAAAGPTGSGTTSSASTSNSTSGSSDNTNDKQPFVAILAPARVLYRWISEIKRTCPGAEVRVWSLSGSGMGGSRNEASGAATNANTTAGGHGKPYFLLCVMEQLGDLLYDPSGPFFVQSVAKAVDSSSQAASNDESFATPTTAASSGDQKTNSAPGGQTRASLNHVQGIIVDDRGVHLRAVHTGMEDWRLRHIRQLHASGILTEKQAEQMSVQAVEFGRGKNGPPSPVGILADHLNAADYKPARRCLVSDSLPTSQQIGSFLAFLIPPSMLLNLSSQETGVTSPVEAAAAWRLAHWCKWAEQCQVAVGKGVPAAVKGYPAGLLAALSVLLALSPEDDRLIDNQTREEIMPVALASGAQTQKYDALCRCLVRTGAFSGTGDNFSTSQLAYGSVVLRDICFNHSFVSLVPSPTLPAQPAVTPDGDAMNTAQTPEKSGNSATFNGNHPSPSDANTDSGCVRCEGTLPGPYFATSHHDSAEKGLFQGSGKLDHLHDVLSRFAELRVVLVVETETQRIALHRFLGNNQVAHIAPGMPLSPLVNRDDGGAALDGSLGWLGAQSQLYDYEEGQGTSGVILVTREAMFTPGLMPREVDVVVVLSENWEDMKTARDICRRFQLRLLHAGHTGDPVTVVRVVAKGTMDETLTRNQLSLVRSQGMPIRALLGSAAYPHLPAPAPSTSPTSAGGILTNGTNDAPIADGGPDFAVFQAAPAGLQTASMNPYYDMIECILACHTASYEGDETFVKAQLVAAITQAFHDYIFGGAVGASTAPDAQTANWREMYKFHQSWAGCSRYSADSKVLDDTGGMYASQLVSQVLDPLLQLQLHHNYSTSSSLSASSSVHRKKGKANTSVSATAAANPVRGASIYQDLPLRLHMLRTANVELEARKKEFLEDISMQLATAEHFETPSRSFKKRMENMGGAADMDARGASGLSKGERDMYRLVNTHGSHPDSITITPTHGISSSCALAFRETLNDHRRAGEDMDPHLYVNPIQNASRADTVEVASWLQASYEADSSVSISYREKQTELQQSLRMRTPRTGDGSIAKRKLLEQGPIMGLNYKRVRLEVEKDGATAPIPRAGAQGAYSYRPQLMTVAAQRTKPEIAEANNKAAGWRPAEDETIMIVQTLLKDPRFVLTTYAVNKLPDNSPTTFSSVGGRSVKKVRDRYEYLTLSGKYTEGVKGRIGAKIMAIRDAIRDSGDAETEVGGPGEGGANVTDARETDRLHRIMSAVDHIGMGPEAEKATEAVRAKERATAILAAYTDNSHSVAAAPAGASHGTMQTQTRHSVQASGAALTSLVGRSAVAAQRQHSVNPMSADLMMRAPTAKAPAPAPVPAPAASVSVNAAISAPTTATASQNQIESGVSLPVQDAPQSEGATTELEREKQRPSLDPFQLLAAAK